MDTRMNMGRGQAQKLDTMNRTESQPELLYELEAITIRALHTNGLEWTDEEGKTPLILACMESALFHVAKFLIELGANVNAFCPGPDGGTPLHYGAKRGLEQTIELLLSHRANALVRNDNNQTPLDVARSQRHSYVVRAIENHICYFKGWMREFSGPWFLEAVTPQLVSRNVWVVVVPYSEEPLMLEIIIYPTQQVEPPSVLSNTRTSSLDASQPTAEAINTNGWGSSGDSSSYNGWGTSLGAKHSLEENTNGWIEKPVKDDYNGWGLLDSKPVDQLTENNLGSSGDSSSYDGWGTSLGAKHSLEENTNGWMDKPVNDEYNGWGLLDSKPVDYQLTENVQSHDNNSPIVSLASCSSAFALSVPSAPPIPDEVLSEGSTHCPSINSSALDLPVPSMTEAGMSNIRNNGDRDSSCAICWNASTEGACIPCGHLAGCMPCLNEVKVKKGVCPICLAKIDQVVRLYAV